MRADQLLVAQGLAPSRSAAQRLIERGAVRWRGAAGWVVPRKAGEALPEGCAIEVTDDAETRWASRGGLKLDAALERSGIAVEGLVCLDVGQSSGGFTDVLLARGAKQVVGVDVGRGQLHPRLKADPRVVAFEGINARALDTAALPQACFDLVVADLSFISLALVMPALAQRIARDALLLVKPQFESRPGDDIAAAATQARVEQRIRAAVAAAGLRWRDYFASAVAGGDGTTEFFAWVEQP